MNIACTILWISLLGADDRPVPKFPLGKNTTYVTGPLDKEGYIDYESALNERLKGQIRPETNAVPLLIRALGRKPGRTELPPKFFHWLGTDPLPERADYFVELRDYLKRDPKIESEQRDAISDDQWKASRAPWSATDHPQVAAWLKANEKSLALGVEASRRREYFLPVASRKGGAGGLVGYPTMPVLGGCRELGRALVTRAMLQTQEGQLDAAWQDLLAAHRLARLVGRGPTIMDALTGFALDGTVVQAEIVWLQSKQLTAKQIQQSQRDVESLSPLPVIHEKADLGERLQFLDAMQILHGKGFQLLKLHGAEIDPENVDPKLTKAFAAINWGMALREGNRRQDQLVAALKNTDRADREKKLEALTAASNWPPDPNQVITLLKKNAAEKEIAEVLVTFSRVAVDGAVHKMQGHADAAEQRARNLRVAIALAGYHAEHGAYPEKLEGLAPKYFAAVPGDLYSGQPLIYRRNGAGYQFYSVGANGRDEGGRWFNDDPPGDDPGVRVPLIKRK